MNSATATRPHSGDKPAPGHALRTALGQAWGQRSPRERQLLGLGALVLALATLWSVALAPVWRIWQEAPARQARLDAQSQQMQQLRAQAQSLRKPSPITRAEAQAWLENNLTELGPEARISVQGERVTLSLVAAPAEAMALWLSQARERVQVLPVQAELQQSPTPTSPPKRTITPPESGSAPPTAAVLWRGTLVMRLP
jgi:general secretion pathway protein M